MAESWAKFDEDERAWKEERRGTETRFLTGTTRASSVGCRGLQGRLHLLRYGRRRRGGRQARRGAAGFLYVDDEIVARAAAKGGIGPDEIADAERRKTLVGAGMPDPGQELGSEDLRALIREAIEQTAARGNVVIVAHAASQVVPRGPEALRVLVTASPGTRAERLGDEGARQVKDEDAARRDYLKRFYGVDEESPTHYDLVINTDVLSVEQAADIVSRVSSR